METKAAWPVVGQGRRPKLPGVASPDPEVDGWLKLWQIGITPGLAGIWTGLGTALLVAAGAAAISLEAALHPDWRSFNLPLAAASVVVAVPMTFLAHEAIHGLAFRAFGGRPQFGGGAKFGMPYFFTACPGRRFVRARFLVVGLAPLIVLDAVARLLMLPGATAFFGAGLLVFNTSGAVGDLWFAAVLLQAPGWVEIEDTGPTFIAWAPPEREHDAAGLRPPSGADPSWGAWIMVWYAATLGIAIAGSALLGALTRSAGAVWIGPLFLASRHELNVAGGLLVAAAAAAPITVMAAMLRASLRRSRR